MKKGKITAFVQNQNSVLTRLMALLAKHQFQIESLWVGCTEVEDVSKVTVIVKEETGHKFRQLVKQVEKQIEVLFVMEGTDLQVVEEQFELIKAHNSAKVLVHLKD